MFLQRGYLAWEKIHRRTNLTVQKPVFALSVKCRIPFRVLLTDKIYHFSFPLQPLIDGGKTQKFPKFGGNLSQKNKKAVTDVRRAPILHRIRAVLHTVVLSLTVSKTHPSYTNQCLLERNNVHAFTLRAVYTLYLVLYQYIGVGMPIYGVGMPPIKCAYLHILMILKLVLCPFKKMSL
jgi:hypothetical protein